jgi:hypothetical protein
MFGHRHEIDDGPVYPIPFEDEGNLHNFQETKEVID